MILKVGLLVFWLGLVGVFLCMKVVFAAVDNGDFESGLDGWEASNGAVTFERVSGQGHSGEYGVKVEHDKTGSYGIQTVVPVDSGKLYEVKVWVKGNEGSVKKAFVRIAWYESEDGSGSQLSTKDSSEVENPNDWVELTVVEQVPEQAQSAKIRLVLASAEKGSSASVIFDDVGMNVVDPSPTPAPTATNTPKPTATSKPEPTATPVPKLPTEAEMDENEDQDQDQYQGAAQAAEELSVMEDLEVDEEEVSYEEAVTPRVPGKVLGIRNRVSPTVALQIENKEQSASESADIDLGTTTTVRWPEMVLGLGLIGVGGYGGYRWWLDD